MRRRSSPEVHGTTMPPAPIGTHTPPRPPAGIIGTHTPPRPPAGMRRPLGVLQNAWLEPGRDDLLNRNQLPLNTDTFGRRGGSCSKQTLVITTPCSSPNTRSALSALGPPLVEMNCAIDSPSRCPASRAGLFGALAQIAFAIQDSERQESQDGAAPPRRDFASRRQPAAAPPAPAHLRKHRTHARARLYGQRLHLSRVRQPSDHRASRARASPGPPHRQRQPWARNRYATHARAPAALAVPLASPASTHAGTAPDVFSRARRLCSRLRRRPTAAAAESSEAAVAGFSPPHARFAQPQSGAARQSGSCAQAPTAAAAPRRRRRGEYIGAATRELDNGAARERRGAGFHRRGR